jgi:uncharacterized membrane protein SpoIIM required for sporulation
MTPDHFVRAREQAWAELDGLVAEARGRVERLGPEKVLDLGRRYRAVVADLALARRSFPGDPVVARLEQAVGRARHLVYGSQARRRSPLSFLATGYGQRVSERPVLLAVSALLLLGPLVLCALWAHDDPGTAARVAPEMFQGVTEPKPGGADLGLSSADRAAFSIRIFVNNIRVAFTAFAGGITAGLLTAGALLYNGLLIGVVTGLAIESGNGDVFFQLVIAHGVLELSCIVVAGMAGLRVGWALVDPGRRRRSEALAAEARVAVELVLGTAVWLVVAGLVEGLLTPAGLGRAVNWSVGLGLGALFWALVLLRGRRPSAFSPQIRVSGPVFAEKT